MNKILNKLQLGWDYNWGELRGGGGGWGYKWESL